MSQDDHHKYIAETLHDWVIRNRDSLGILYGSLIEDEDFFIAFITDQSSVHVRLACSCGVRIKLIKHGEHFTLTNYYKHLKKAKCSMLKRKEKTNVINNETFDSINNDRTNDSMRDQELSSAMIDEDSSNYLSSWINPGLYSIPSSAASNSTD